MYETYKSKGQADVLKTQFSKVYKEVQKANCLELCQMIRRYLPDHLKTKDAAVLSKHSSSLATHDIKNKAAIETEKRTRIASKMIVYITLKSSFSVNK
jgi:hypothetical protein